MNNIQELIKNGSNINVTINITDLRLILDEAIGKSRPEATKQELSRFLTPQQLSELIGWKLTTVYQNRHNGFIPGAKKIGGKLLFDTKTILEWIEGKSIPTRAEKVRALTAKVRAK